MEIRILRYFLEVAREGSITHAAKRLHISQPTLSKQLKDLEGELGKKLFTRSSFSVHLTDEGMLLRKRAEDILDMVNKTEEEFVSRQGLREDMPRLFGEKVDQLNVTATINLTYNGTILVREGIGYVLTFDKLANTSRESELCFRPLAPRLETKLYVIWKKCQAFSPAAELLLQEMKAA